MIFLRARHHRDAGIPVLTRRPFLFSRCRERRVPKEILVRWDCPYVFSLQITHARTHAHTRSLKHVLNADAGRRTGREYPPDILRKRVPVSYNPVFAFSVKITIRKIQRITVSYLSVRFKQTLCDLGYISKIKITSLI